MKFWVGRAQAFILTFLAYMCIHICRKPPSILKAILHPQDRYDSKKDPGWGPFNQDLVPSIVAQHGLNVNGARLDNENGKYLCIQQEPTITDEEGQKICTRFKQDNENPFIIARVEGSLCKKFVDSSYEKAFCWIIEPFFAKPRSHPLYVQLFDGYLPRPVQSEDVNLETKAWKALQKDLSYEPYHKLRVRPNVQDGKLLLGLVDTSFLLAYTVGLFISGWVADRVDIRKFLTLGMISSGLSSIFLGFAHRAKVHSLSYFIVMSAWGGLSQSVGWPCVITVMGRWFPRTYRRRGLIMGLWFANISIGNILGSVITTACVSWGMDNEDWPLGFEVPGWIVICCSALVFFFLEVDPRMVDVDEASSSNEAITSPLRLDTESIEDDDDEDGPEPSIMKVLLIPGVIPFAFSICFAKMAQYALLYWGPYYLQVIGFSSERAGYLCSFFDVGGLLGGIAAGWFSDRLGGKRGTAACLFLLIASIVLPIYYKITSEVGPKTEPNVWMMILVGFWINGPVGLITTAVSADLGSHPSLNGDERLIASVVGVIDGVGSFGGALQATIVGVISTTSWNRVFEFLMICSIVSASCLAGVVRRELMHSYHV